LSELLNTAYYRKKIIYKELLEQVEKLATYLKDQGINKGDRVGLYMLNSPHWVISYFGILSANAVVVPMNPLYKSQELEYLIKDSGIKMIITTSDRVSNLENIKNNFDIKILVGRLSQYLPKEPELSIPDFMM